MIALLQRVREASVQVDDALVAAIGPGLLALVGVEKDDTEREARRLAERILSYRVFADHRDRMNLSLQDVAGELLLVPQFTLAVDTTRGNRPSFSTAAEPERATALFVTLKDCCRESPVRIASGFFGADMQVALINDWPVTFSFRVAPCRPTPSPLSRQPSSSSSPCSNISSSRMTTVYGSSAISSIADLNPQRCCVSSAGLEPGP